MKKLLPYILILFILAGFFGVISSTQAQTTPNPMGTCVFTTTTAPITSRTIRGSQDYCNQIAQSTGETLKFTPDSTTPPAGTGGCYVTGSSGTVLDPSINKANCTGAGKDWVDATTGTAGNKVSSGNVLQDNLKDCGASIADATFDGCIEKFFFYVVYAVPAYILEKSAVFFNALINLTLNSNLYKSGFISSAWEVVRDLSNIFFILVLLYIAIKVILGLGGSDVKKMIVNVIIMALLINFSMFFTKVIIDASNTLALVFYNKLNVVTKVNGVQENYIPLTVGERDVSGAMIKVFDPTRLLTQEFFDKLKKPVVPESILGGNTGAVAVGSAALVAAGATPIVGQVIVGGYLVKKTFGYFFPGEEIPMPMILAIIFISGAIICFAIYAFSVAGVAFLSRLIELVVLIIFSPFAFMSFSVPFLSGVEKIGWQEWFKRLLKCSFMAPIFLFFVYLIFKLLEANIFQDFLSPPNASMQTPTQIIILIVIPALLILKLLLSAAEFSKKWSGEIGEMAMKASNMATGFAIGAITGGAATLGRASIGRVGALAANSEWAKRREAEGRFGSGVFRTAAKAVGSGSFDIRGVKIAGKDLGGATGLKVGEAQKGGFTERREAQVKKRQERARELEVGEDEALKQHLNELEEQKQGLLRDVSHDIEQLDNRLKTWRERATDARRASAGGRGGDDSRMFSAALGRNFTNDELQTASENNIAELRAHRNAIKNGEDFTPTAVSAIDPAHAGHVQTYSTRTRTAATAAHPRGRSINDLEDIDIPLAHHHIEVENRNRKWNYARTTESNWTRVKGHLLGREQFQYSQKGAREAAHKIRMEAKLDSGEKGGH